MVDEARITWSGAEVVSDTDLASAPIRVTAVSVEALYVPIEAITNIRVTAMGVETVFTPPLAVTPIRITFLGLEVLLAISDSDDLTDTFTPLVSPTIESTVTFDTTVVQAGLNSPYTQSAKLDINAVTGTYSLVWDGLDWSTLQSLESFFITRAGNVPFKYTIPSESTEKYFKCKTWNRQYKGGKYTLTAEFRQMFVS